MGNLIPVGEKFAPSITLIDNIYLVYHITYASLPAPQVVQLTYNNRIICWRSEVAVTTTTTSTFVETPSPTSGTDFSKGFILLHIFTLLRQ